MRVVTTYDKVTYRSEKKVPCSGCEKPLKRARTFWQTLNPFNKNAAGYPKSRQQITDELRAEAGAWRKEPEYCSDEYCQGLEKSNHPLRSIP